MNIIYCLSYLLIGCQVITLSKLIVKESIEDHLADDFEYHYQRVHDPHPQSIHEVLIAIKQNNLDKVHKLLYEVSSKSSPKFGQFLSFEQVGEIVKNPEATQNVLEWLQSNNIDVKYKTTYGEYIRARGTISQWETMLNTKFSAYQSKPNTEDDLRDHTDIFIKRHDTIIYRVNSYSVPEEIYEDIFTIHHLVHLPPPIVHHSIFKPITDQEAFELTSSNQPFWHPADMKLNTIPFHTYEASKLSTYVTPVSLRSIYNITGTGNGYSSQAIYESGGQTYLASDLTLFQHNFTLCNNGIESSSGKVPSNQTCSSTPANCVYASMDIQYVRGIAGITRSESCLTFLIVENLENVPTTFWYDDSTGDFLVNFVTTVADSDNPAHIFSIGYGAYEFQVSSETRTTFDTEAQKAGLRGVTFISAAGNDGVAGYHFRVGTTQYPISKCGYFPMWPATSAYVTAIGGTMDGKQLTGLEEAAATSVAGAALTSGGGFSQYTVAPSYQKNIVNAYLSKFTPPTSTVQNYVRNNRAYPDLSMPANNYCTCSNNCYVYELFDDLLVSYVNGEFVLVSGTSAACAVFAGMISLVNAYRIQFGLSSTGLGWLNPSLYEADGYFTLHDFKSGHNNCTANPDYCCNVGFQATEGWDPVSGFGSIDFDKLLDYYTDGNIVYNKEEWTYEYICYNRVITANEDNSIFTTLSGGAIAGITIAALLVFIGVSIWMYSYYNQRYLQKKYTSTSLVQMSKLSGTLRHNEDYEAEDGDVEIFLSENPMIGNGIADDDEKD